MEKLGAAPYSDFEAGPRCNCQDNQRHFLERAFAALGLEHAQRELRLDSFREVLVQIFLEVRCETS